VATVKKDEAAKMVVRKLEAQRSKMVEKEKEWMEELYANSQELDSQLLSKTKELERVTSSLQEITEKMVKESNNLAECRKELKMKKSIIKVLQQGWHGMCFGKKS
jgi:chromosome segregation ATPase